MSQDPRRKRTPAPASLPPLTPELDVSWDDETLRLKQNPLLEEEEAFERVTAIPGVPFEDYARKVMEAADHEDAEESGVRDVDQPQPTARSVPDSVPPVLGGFFQASPEAPPSSTTTTAPPPDDRRVPPFASEPSGLELDLHSTLPPMTTPSVEYETWSDPRDPELELDLDLGGLAAEAPAPQQTSRRTSLKDRFAMGDFSGALEIAEQLLQTEPNDLEAQRYANRCRDTLIQMFSARLGALDRSVSVAVPSDQIRWLSLDHRAGFLLSLIDGSSSIEQLLDICGMPRLDALRILHTLLEQRVIALTSR